MKKLIFYLLTVGVVLGLVLSGCAKPAPTPAVTPKPAPAPTPTLAPAPTPSPTPKPPPSPSPTPAPALPKQVRIFSASVGTENYGGHSYWAEILTKDLKIPTGAFPGVYESNMKLMEAGEAEMGLGMPMYLELALKGEAPFEKPLKNLRFVCTHYPGRTYSNVLLTRMDSKIYKLEDIIGKKVAVASRGELAEWLGLLQMKAAGVTKEKVQAAGGVVVNMSYKAMADGLADGTIDAGWVNATVTAVHSSFVMVNERWGVRVVPVPKEALDKILKERADVLPCTIKGGVYKGSPDAVPGITQGVFMFTRADIPEDFIYKIMKVVYTPSYVDEVKKKFPMWGEFGGTEEGLIYSTLLPMHPGAAKFWSVDRKVDLKARGITVK